MVQRRQLVIWGLLATGVVGASIIVVAPMLVLGRPGTAPSPSRIVTETVAAAVGIAWAFAFAALAFRRMDEYQQTASKFATYWGCTLGIAASLPVYVFVARGGLHWIDPAHFHLGADLFRAFVIGYALPIVFQLVGFLAVRGWWRLAKR